MSKRSPRMTPALFHVLLAVAEGPKHGYALLGAIRERSEGHVDLGPSSLYYALGRLEDAGLIAETAVTPGHGGDEPHEEQRRYFVITDEGRAFLRDELGVLNDIVEHARSIGFAAGPRS